MPREKFILWIGAVVALGALILNIAYRSEIVASGVALPLLYILFGIGVALTTYGLFRMRLRELETARTKTTKSLEDSQVRFEELFHYSPIPTIVTSLAEGKVLAANQSASVQFQVSAERAQELTAVDFYVDPTERAAFRDEVLRRGRSSRLLHLRTFAGGTFWASVSARRITYEGTPAVLSIFYDVTEQINAEKALRSSEQRLAAQSAAVTALMERQAGNFILEDRLPDILQVCARTLGVGRASMWQFADDRSFIVCVDLYDAAAGRYMSGQVLQRVDFPGYFSALEHARLIAAADAHNDISTKEFSAPYLTPNGIGAMLDVPLHQNHVATGVLCLEHIGGARHWTVDEQNFALSVANLIALAITDAERREATARLAESESRARLIVDTAHDAFVGMNSDGEIVNWNAQAVSTFGWEAEEVLGRSLADTVIPLGFREGHRRGLRRFLESGEAPVVNQRLELTALHKNGSEFPIEITITNPIRSDHGYFFGAFIRDISQRKQREEELKHAKESAEAATRAKSEFLANMSHELRTPLNGVLGYAQLMQRGASLTPDQRESLDAIAKCGSHLLDLINDILDLSKIEAGRMELEPVPTDLRQLAVDLAHVIAEPARRKGLRFSVEIDSELPSRVVVDGRHLRQVLLNLLGNAVKFTPSGDVTLLITRRDERLYFEVRDTGLGIEEENIKRIFEAFRQTRAGAAAGGSGLGLAISQQLVRAMGGDLGVRSKVGVGSSFFFDIPMTPAEASIQAVQEDEPVLGSHLAAGCRLTALVADDSAINRRILASLLESAGAQVITAGGGVEAVELTRQYKPDVVLMDLRMDDLDGLAATRRILAEPETAGTRVIMVTASAFGDSRQAALDAGCVDFVVKPVRAEQLFAKLQRHLDVRFVDSDSEMSPGQDLPLPVGAHIEAMGRRLHEAASIGNIGELEALSLELSKGTAAEAALGARIDRLLSHFNFPALLDIAERIRNQKEDARAAT